MPLITKQETEKILKQAFSDNNAEFRDGQWEAINEIINKALEYFELFIFP